MKTRVKTVEKGFNPMSNKPIRSKDDFLVFGSPLIEEAEIDEVVACMQSGWLGTGPVAEAYLIAFSLPNMFRRFFAEGAFNMAFVPLFAKRLEGSAPGDGGDGARRFAENDDTGHGEGRATHLVLIRTQPELGRLAAADLEADTVHHDATPYESFAVHFKIMGRGEGVH